MRWKLLLVMGAMVLAACSDDDDAAGDKPTFPSPVALTCAPQDGKPGEVSFTFHADDDWMLNSDKIWCQFKDADGNTVRTLAGDEGDQTVTLVVNGDAQNFSDATAEIAMTMEGYTENIATVNRSAKGYQVIAYKGNDKTDLITAKNPVAFAYRTGLLASQTFHVTANFDWQIDRKALPDWLTVDADANGNHLTGRAGEVVTVSIDFAEGARKGNALSGTFRLTDRAGVEHGSVPVTYPGMGDYDLEVPSSSFNLTFSKDGASHWTANSTTGDKENMGEGAYKIKVDAKGDIVPCYFEYSTKWQAWNVIQTQWGLQSWFNVALDKNGNAVVDKDGYVSFTVNENTGESRQGQLVFVTRKFYDEKIDGDPTNLMDDDGIKPEYASFIAAKFTQEGSANTAKGFKIKDGMTYQDITVDGLVSLSDMGYDDQELIADYGTTNVWAWSASSYPESIAIFPNGFSSNAEPFFEIKDQWDGIEPGSTTWPSAGVTLIIDNAQASTSKMMQVRFLNTDGSVYATLVFMKYDARKRQARRAAYQRLIRKANKH